MIHWDDAAHAAVAKLVNDPRLGILSDRVNEVLDKLEVDHHQPSLRRHRMHQPAVWAIFVSGSGEDWAVLWEPNDDDEPYIHYAGPSWL
jgi:hypothetical protein